MRVSIFIHAFLLFSSFEVFAKNFVFNMSGSIQGYGDVVGVMSIAITVKKNNPTEKVYAVIDERAREVIDGTYGSVVAASEKYSLEFIDISDARTMPKSDYSFETFFGGRKIHHFSDVVFNKPDTVVFICDTMHGNTFDEIRMPKEALSLYMKPPGISIKRSGIVNDPYLHLFRNKKKSEILRELEPVLQKPNFVRLLKDERFAFSFMYGIHNTDFVKPSLLHQGKLFIEALSKKYRNKPIVVFTPNKLSHIQKTYPGFDKIYDAATLNAGQIEEINNNKISIVMTGKLSGKVFTGFVAFSDLPVFVEGNNSVSLAIRLAKPFVLMRSAWNFPQVDDLVSLEQHFLQSDYIYEAYKDGPDVAPDFEKLINNLPDKIFYAALSNYLPDFPSKMSGLPQLADSYRAILNGEDTASRETAIAIRGLISTHKYFLS